MSKILNFSDAMRLAEILDKPTLTDIDDSFTVEEFAVQVLESVDDTELDSLLLLLFGDELENLDRDNLVVEFANALLENSYFQLMEVYHKFYGSQ